MRFAKRARNGKLFPMQFLPARPLLLWPARVLALILIALWIQRSAIPTFYRTDQQRDMVLYYQAARNVNAGRALYTARPGYGPDSKPFEYLYPPPFAAFIAPMGALPWLMFARVWTIGLIASFLGFAWCLCALSERPNAWNFVGWLALLCVFPGAARALSLGQVDPLLWFLSALSVWAVGLSKSARWDKSARLGVWKRVVGGVVLGAASLIKIYAAWPLFSIKQNEGRAPVWCGALAVGALGFALGALVCGFDSYAQWARAVLPIAGQGTFNPDNYSFSMGVLRAAQGFGWHYAGGPLVGLPKAWLNVAAVGGPLLALCLTRHLSLRPRVALITVAAAWCAPLCWSTYLPLALIPLALAVAAWRNRDATRKPGAQVEPFGEDLN